MQSRFDKGYGPSEEQGLVQDGHPSTGAKAQTSLASGYGKDQEDLLPVVLERYLEKAGVM